MKIMNKAYSLLALAFIAHAAAAQDSGILPEANLTGADVSAWNVGAGFTQKLLHVNTEWVNPYGIAYVKAGAFLNGDKTFGAQAGFRHPIHFTGKDKNGYYLGVYAGHIESKDVDGDYESRLGGGVDLSYVMLSKERISTFSVGIGAGEELTDSSGRTIAETEPKIQFSYTLSIGL